MKHSKLILLVFMMSGFLFYQGNGFLEDPIFRKDILSRKFKNLYREAVGYLVYQNQRTQIKNI